MSFLPYSNAGAGAWYSSLTASIAAHGGVVAMVVVSAIPLLPTPVLQDDPLGDVVFDLGFEKIEQIPELEPLTEEDLQAPIEPDLVPDEIVAETPDAQELDPVEDALEAEEMAEEAETLVPVEADAEPETPSDNTLEPESTELAETTPDAVEPDAATEVLAPLEAEPLPEEAAQIEPLTQVEPLTQAEAAPIPQVAEPQDISPLPEPETIADAEPVAPDPVPTELEPLETVIAEVPATPITPADPVEQSLDIASADSIFEDVDDVVSPLASGGGGTPLEPEAASDLSLTPTPVEDTGFTGVAVEIETEELALLLPEDTVPTPVPVPDEPSAPEPVALPVEEPSTDQSGDDSTVPETDQNIGADDTALPAETDDATSEAPGETPLQSARGRVISAPSPQARAIGQLIRAIRTEQAPSCTAALPRRTAGEGIGVSLIGSDDVVLSAFSERAFAGLETPPVQVLEIVDSRQCSVLDVLRQVDDYPATRLAVALDDAALASGEFLAARVLGAGGLYVSVMLIDDNGVVQDLERFSEASGTELLIDAPVARSGGTRDTRQLLLVIGHPEQSLDLSLLDGELAQDVFTSLPLDVLTQARFGLATFDVK